MKKISSYLVFLLLFVPPLIFFTDLTRNPYYFQIVLLNCTIVLLWLVYLYQASAAGRVVLRRTPLDLPLGAFFIVATLSWLAMLFQNLHEPYLSYGVFSEGYRRWIYLLVNSLLAMYAAVYFVDDGNRPRYTQTLFWVGMLASVYGVLQYFSIEFFWPRVLNPFGGRSVSTFGNPNFLSSYLVILFPLLYVHYLRAESGAKRFFYLLFMVTYFAALLCTLTRSSWLGVFVAMGIVVAVLFLYERNTFVNRTRALFVPFGILVLLTLFWPKSNIQGYNPTVIGRLTETSKAETEVYAPWHQRRLIWSCAWHMIVERPVLGKGWGCFELFYPSYQGRHLFLDTYRTFRTHANNTHNEILEIWSQTGTLGFGIYLWFLATFFGYGFFLIKNLSGEKRYLAAAIVAGSAGMLADNLLNVSLHFAVPGFLYWWNIGILLGLGASEEVTVDLNPLWRKALVWAFIALGVLLLVRFVNSFLGEVHYFNGFKLSKRGEVMAAVSELEAAHRYQRLEVNNNYELANCYARANEWPKSIEGYKEALRANAGYDEIYYNMATVMLRMGRIPEAVQEYTRSLYINPLSLEAYAAFGSICIQDPARYGKVGLALFDQCVKLFPNNKDVWNNIGYLNTKLGNDETALAAYKKSLEIDPDFEMARRNIRFTLQHLGKTDREFSESEALFGTAEQYIAARNWSAALPVCAKLVSRMPQSFRAHLYLANIYFTMGKLTDAIPEYQAAQKLQPDNPSASGNLGLCYFENRQYDLARVQLERSLKGDPNNKLARQKLDEINRLQRTGLVP